MCKCADMLVICCAVLQEKGFRKVPGLQVHQVPKGESGAQQRLFLHDL
jgi:hypothetical protein